MQLVSVLNDVLDETVVLLGLPSPLVTAGTVLPCVYSVYETDQKLRWIIVQFEE